MNVVAKTHTRWNSDLDGEKIEDVLEKVLLRKAYLKW
jgi:hypothetical protein